jgi:hypothetical protein
MSLRHFSLGELCPSTGGGGCVALPRRDVDTSTTPSRVMSRGCDHCRFHKYAAIMSTTDCWLWTGTFYSQFGKPTYGQLWFDGRKTGAHRVSYELHVGPVPAGLDVLHSCDIKACVNPAHLRPGTHGENIREAFAKLPPGHFAGENAGRARLTWADVREIRRLSAAGVRRVELASRYGVTAVQISHIVLNKRWVHDPLEAEAVA